MKKRFCPICGSELKNKQIESHHRLYCLQCQQPVYENPVPATAGLVTDSEGRLLLVKRSVKPGEGKWCLPGGFLEIGESLEQCVLRELKEETSLSGKVDRFLGIEISDNLLYESVMVAGYTIMDIQGSPLPGDDASEIGFFYPEKLPEIAFSSHLHFISLTKKSRIPHAFGAYAITSGNAVSFAEEVCRAGVECLQYRDKCALPAELLKVAKSIREITRKHNTCFIVNDHIDVALIVEADGIHLGQNDIPIRDARRLILPSMIIGISTHSLNQAKQAADEGADYIGIGPVFNTPTKSTYPPIGFEVVRSVLTEITIPVVAIGGINLQNIDQLKRMGVKNVAMVREYQNNPYELVQKVNTILRSDER